jgi:Holliday junction resolvasome RuvABC endonuclease subunit
MMESETIYIGLDPSLAAIGWAMLEGKDYRTGGVYVPKGNLDEKLGGAYIWLGDWLYQCECNSRDEVIVVIEMPFVGQNANTHYKLSAMSGALRAAACVRRRKIIPVAPTQRCRAVGLKGNAGKKEILARVNEIYNLDIDNFDESDAIAVALAGREEEMK